MINTKSTKAYLALDVSEELGDGISVGLNANRREDGGDGISVRGVVAAEAEEQVGCEVAHLVE